MSLLVPKSTHNMMLQLITNKTVPEDLIVKLYVNEKDPKEDDVEFDYEEAEGGGYESVTLDPEKWTIKENKTKQGETTEAVYPNISFKFNGSIGDIYGYYVIQKDSKNIMWADRFDSGPHDIKNNGDEIMVTLKYRIFGK